jgi:thioredoxin-like negative regulator of GroEL
MPVILRATFAFALTLLLVAAPGVARAPEIEWERSYVTALKKAKAKGQPIMVDFFADWCTWCKRLDSDVYTDPKVVETARRFVSVKLNTDTDPEGKELAKKHGVTGLPTILFLNGDGQVIGRIGGFRPAAPFRQAMEGVEKVNRDLPRLKRDFRQRTGDVQTAVRMAEMASQLGDEALTKEASARASRLDPKDAGGHRAKALRALAELYVGRKDIKQAVPVFHEVARVATRAEDRGYSLLSAGYGLLVSGDLRGGVREFLTALRTPTLLKKDHEFARQILGTIPTPLW